MGGYFTSDCLAFAVAKSVLRRFIACDLAALFALDSSAEDEAFSRSAPS
jgi:hypothetical protein